ncbi:hypothetical protein [Actinokineospora iranica]|uniref:Uncharacterized protein n=1 Tax=Actinokineospora iranica TaxID=1271860 RepID=A0A1G6LGQ0_9PSEU|nr:hypothetical protein [Actinokineospora iranica]SDC42409.1 hypothetical protein SAMN05216174_10264 [Actinokineospora iranica]
MDSLADRLDSLRLRVQAPGSEIYADLRNRKDVSVSFGESVYEWTSERNLERQLVSMARLLYAQWVRKYRAELSDSFLNAMGAESQNDHDFLAARSELESSGASRDGRVTISAVGMQNVEVRIVPGTVRELDEHEFSGRVSEAVHALADDYQTKIRELKIRYFT